MHQRLSRYFQMVRIGLFVIGVTAFAELASSAQSDKNSLDMSSRPYAMHTDDAAANDEVRAKLDRQVKAIDFNGNEFSDAVDFISDMSKVEIKVDWASLKKIHIGPAAIVTEKLKSVTFCQALDRILADVGAGHVSLTSRVTNGMVIIQAANDLPVVVMVYNISAMLKAHPVDTEKFLAVIRNEVDPGSWVEYAGRSGMMYLDRGTLYVTQTPENQQAIQKLLDEFKAGPQGQGK
jgi:hypothetical protein